MRTIRRLSRRRPRYVLDRQYFGGNSFVVVNSREHYSPLGRIEPARTGYVDIYESTMTENRMDKTISTVEQLANAVSMTPKPNTVKININRKEFRQEIIGFGGGFTDSAGENIASLPKVLSDRLIADYFGPDGLAYSIARVPIGGTDFSPRPYTYLDGDEDIELTEFKIAKEDLIYKIPYILKALELNKELMLVGSAWSPPGWMKTNGDIKGGGTIKGRPGEIYWKAAAAYLIKFLEAYRLFGIEFWGLTTGNQPTNGHQKDFPYNCCLISPENMRDWIKSDLGPQLKTSSLAQSKVKLLIHDDTRKTIQSYSETVLSDPEAAKYVSGIAFHWYMHSSETFYAELDSEHYKFPNYFLISTQASEGWEKNNPYKVTLGDWSRMETYAADIMECLNRWTCGWMDHNLALNLRGGPNWASNCSDSPIIVDPVNHVYYKQPMYYGIGHFSKFLSPGSVVLGHSFEADSHGVRCVCAVDPFNQMIIVLMNASELEVTLVINGFATKPIQITLEARSIVSIVTKCNDDLAGEFGKSKSALSLAGIGSQPSVTDSIEGTKSSTEMIGQTSKSSLSSIKEPSGPVDSPNKDSSSASGSDKLKAPATVNSGTKTSITAPAQKPGTGYRPDSLTMLLGSPSLGTGLNLTTGQTGPAKFAAASKSPLGSGIESATELKSDSKTRTMSGPTKSSVDTDLAMVFGPASAPLNESKNQLNKSILNSRDSAPRTISVGSNSKITDPVPSKSPFANVPKTSAPILTGPSTNPMTAVPINAKNNLPPSTKNVNQPTTTATKGLFIGPINQQKNAAQIVLSTPTPTSRAIELKSATSLETKPASPKSGSLAELLSNESTSSMNSGEMKEKSGIKSISSDPSPTTVIEPIKSDTSITEIRSDSNLGDQKLPVMPLETGKVSSVEPLSSSEDIKAKQSADKLISEKSDEKLKSKESFESLAADKAWNAKILETAVELQKKESVPSKSEEKLSELKPPGKSQNKVFVDKNPAILTKSTGKVSSLPKIEIPGATIRPQAQSNSNSTSAWPVAKTVVPGKVRQPLVIVASRTPAPMSGLAASAGKVMSVFTNIITSGKTVTASKTAPSAALSPTIPKKANLASYPTANGKPIPGYKSNLPFLKAKSKHFKVASNARSPARPQPNVNKSKLKQQTSQNQGPLSAKQRINPSRSPARGSQNPSSKTSPVLTGKRSNQILPPASNRAKGSIIVMNSGKLTGNLMYTPATAKSESELKQIESGSSLGKVRKSGSVTSLSAKKSGSISSLSAKKSGSASSLPEKNSDSEANLTKKPSSPENDKENRPEKKPDKKKSSDSDKLNNK